MILYIITITQEDHSNGAVVEVLFVNGAGTQIRMKTIVPPKSCEQKRERDRREKKIMFKHLFI